MRNDQEVRAKALELAIKAAHTDRGLTTEGKDIIMKVLAPLFEHYISEGVVGAVPNRS